jgi:hypothetical protein
MRRLRKALRSGKAKVAHGGPRLTSIHGTDINPQRLKSIPGDHFKLRLKLGFERRVGNS